MGKGARRQGKEERGCRGIGEGEREAICAPSFPFFVPGANKANEAV